uniref:Uncharacterized protein n=1 Tax=Romanomermis culicivorax TaxID=13658 RepID=A0A915KG53_ROMCU
MYGSGSVDGIHNQEKQSLSQKIQKNLALLKTLRDLLLARLRKQNDFRFLDRIDIGFIKLLKASLNVFISFSTQESHDSTYAIAITIAINDNKCIKYIVGII